MPPSAHASSSSCGARCCPALLLGGLGGHQLQLLRGRWRRRCSRAACARARYIINTCYMLHAPPSSPSSSSSF
eukprot:4676964-Pyramimonas_sp.AAC.1